MSKPLHLKLSVEQQRRGKHVVRFPVPPAAPALQQHQQQQRQQQPQQQQQQEQQQGQQQEVFDRCYILASKNGEMPSLDGEFHWAATYLLEDVEEGPLEGLRSSVGCCGNGDCNDSRSRSNTKTNNNDNNNSSSSESVLSEIVAVVDASGWPFQSEEACFTVGLLEVEQPAPRVPPEIGEFAGITFRAVRVLTSPGDSEVASSKLTFIDVGFEAERDLLPAEVQPVYEKYYEAYRDIDGYELSFQATRGMSCPPVALTYGEAHFLPTYRLLELVGVKPGDLIVDLGSGTGRFLLAAVLGYPFLKAWGIEVIETLHEAAVGVCERALGEGLERQRLKLTLGDLRTEDWSNADLVVVMTLCFPEDLLLDVQRLALKLKSGARVVAMHATFGELLFAEEEGEVRTETDAEDDLRWQQLFRPVDLRSESPQHAVPSEMSFGETSLYVFERTSLTVEVCKTHDGRPERFSLDTMD